jgi:hypothetical protein
MENAIFPLDAPGATETSNEIVCELTSCKLLNVTNVAGGPKRNSGQAGHCEAEMVIKKQTGKLNSWVPFSG